MKYTNGIIFTLLLLVVATKGHTVIKCYVCDNCTKIDKNTPLEQCGGEHFTTTPATQGSSVSTTSEATSSTAAPTSHTTGLPTAPTIGPLSSTTDLPTPPSIAPVDHMEHISGHDHDHMNHNHETVNSTSNHTLATTPTVFVTPAEVDLSTTTEHTTVLPSVNSTFLFNETSPSTILVRQRRHTEFNGITYHCYKIQKKYDNVFGTKRGCIGVKTQQSVCTELDIANNNQTQKCAVCTTNKCNGSSTIGISLATLMIALIALLFKA